MLEPQDTEQPDLSIIKVPVENPPAVPDDHTSREIRHAEQLGNLSPTQRHIHAIERHLAECTVERTRLVNEVHTLRAVLDTILPAYAALKESHRNVGANGTFSAVATVLGGVALGVAGLCTDPQVEWLKWTLLGGGIVGTTLAVWQSVKTRIWLWPTKSSESNVAQQD